MVLRLPIIKPAREWLQLWLWWSSSIVFLGLAGHTPLTTLLMGQFHSGHTSYSAYKVVVAIGGSNLDWEIGVRKYCCILSALGDDCTFF